MFGYVKPSISELKIKDYELYKAIYCGLCKNLRDNFGNISRFTLNYDFAFLSLLSAALTDEDCNFSEFRCIVHPLKKKRICLSEKYFNYTSNVAILMLYYKLLDNIDDVGAKNKTIAIGCLPYIKHLYKKAEQLYPDIAKALKRMNDEQNELESQGCCSLDMAAEPTAKVMAIICENISNEPIQKRILNVLGYQLGRWIYMIDATDDFEDDIKKGNYNPFAKISNITELSEDSIKKLNDLARPNLYITLGELIKTYELLDLKRFQPLIDNIIINGLRETTDKIITKGDLQ